MGRRTKLLLVGVVVVLVLGAVTVYIRRTVRAVENAYAVWNVGDLIVAHLQAHNDQWPRSWADLEAACRAESEGRDVSERMSQYRELVTVDFNADPKLLAQLPFDPERQGSPFQVVWYRREPHAYYVEPNVTIWLYLNRKPPFSATMPTTTSAPHP